MLRIETKCPHCGKTTFIEVKAEDWIKWKFGENVQIAFPYLSVAEREMLITGICDDCWNRMFKNEED